MVEEGPLSLGAVSMTFTETDRLLELCIQYGLQTYTCVGSEDPSAGDLSIPMHGNYWLCIRGMNDLKLSQWNRVADVVRKIAPSRLDDYMASGHMSSGETSG